LLFGVLVTVPPVTVVSVVRTAVGLATPVVDAAVPVPLPLRVRVLEGMPGPVVPVISPPPPLRLLGFPGAIGRVFPFSDPVVPAGGVPVVARPPVVVIVPADVPVAVAAGVVPLMPADGPVGAAAVELVVPAPPVAAPPPEVPPAAAPLAAAPAAQTGADINAASAATFPTFKMVLFILYLLQGRPGSATCKEQIRIPARKPVVFGCVPKPGFVTAEGFLNSQIVRRRLG
jgi:hypothetical protein